MEHTQFIIEDIPYNDAEEIIDENLGTKVEFIETYGDNRNRVSIRYTDLSCLYSALQTLYDNGASYSEV